MLRKKNNDLYSTERILFQKATKLGLIIVESITTTHVLVGVPYFHQYFWDKYTKMHI